jgi:hypothetical protein
MGPLLKLMRQQRELQHSNGETEHHGNVQGVSREVAR